jgi:uncharacterized protein YggL (DUF469 family)
MKETVIENVISPPNYPYDGGTFLKRFGLLRKAKLPKLARLRRVNGG